MPSTKTFALVTVLSGMVALPALAIAGAPASSGTARQVAEQDFGKVSKDGTTALRDIRLVRLAIFDGKIDLAKKTMAEAVSALDAAKTDDSVFTKAEADFKAPSQAGQKTAPNASRAQIAWLPVDGAMALDEDYVATAEKTEGVAKANAKLAQGDHKAAMDALKLADVDVDFVVEVAPLKATLAGVQQAQQLLDNGKYYEANQELKTVEDGMRFDTETLVATPQRSGAADQKAKSAG